MGAPVRVKLGEHEVDVYPQRHAYLTNRVGRFLQDLTSTEIGDIDIASVSGLIATAGEKVYDLLSIAIPMYAKRCPRYEFMGYGSVAAYEAREYDEVEDKSPDIDQMITAFEAAAKANRFDLLKIVGRVFDPKLLKSWVNTQVALAISTASANSHAASDGPSESTTSGATTPILSESAGSPSGASTAS